ncbi:phosphate transport system regulatory protein PhoU [Sporanaerobium hydrogeniformans]|uniref:Phosphate transport system regulatory protein PhoU n=1 Tax=Sporanaerobium hydrogeniformans TaxID=3072179 RepID=A0AC61DAP0_9FIRM|nr:phosphate signaling complex protein PhoU [Sporanaerobium hydrogeniformans]PHV70334.1 phosphate transport system regulatory protein PhoU [Sporanaerobium hydrogeniformans]
MLRKQYEKNLKELNQNIVKMGQITERLIDQTIKAITQNNQELAKKTIAEDDIIDAMQLEIEKECALLIALQQPVAGDLRFIISTIKMITDIERIADQCSDICQYILKMEEGSWKQQVSYQRHIEKMALSTKKMLEQTLTSYVTGDQDLVKEVLKSDDEIDENFKKIWKEIKAEMQARPEFIETGMQYIMIIKYLERIADHITNIAEWILYSNTGQYLIHYTSQQLT